MPAAQPAPVVSEPAPALRDFSSFDDPPAAPLDGQDDWDAPAAKSSSRSPLFMAGSLWV
ncbi:MAG: hypothetical protein H6727_05540 [Myxococcales bacterium]|nr:hypothetical protein [Myxococcales bacterium]